MNVNADVMLKKGGGSSEEDPEHFLSSQYWNRVFANPDPWGYGASPYESWKFALTLSSLPVRKARLAVDLGCAEGHLTALLAPRVERLSAVDISPVALERARDRCAGFPNTAFTECDLLDYSLPEGTDLVVCSEVLYYLSRTKLKVIATKFVRNLKVGGHVLLAHANMIVDDSTRTGFDWGHDFGALTIGSVFRGTPGLVPVKEVVTPLFTIQLFRREDRAGRTTPPEPIEIPLPPDLVLPVELERTILWNGALATRAEVRETEMASAVPILMYHSIADDGPVEYAPYRTSTAAFRDQMRYLRRQGYHSVSLEEWVSAIEANRPIPGRPVIITFDDGYKDFLENALPILERSDFHATVFVVTDSVGGIADWEPMSQPLALMSWADLREVMARGMNIGSHTVRHPDLLTVSEDEFRLECDRSAKRLWDELGRQPTVIAYPWGRSHPVARELLAEYGYRIALRSWGGASPLFDDPRNLSRVAIGSDTLESFIEKLRGPFIPDPDDYPLPPGWRDGVDVAGAAASDATDDSVGFADRDSVGFADRDSVGFVDRDPVGFFDRDPVGFVDRDPIRFIDMDPVGRGEDGGRASVTDVGSDAGFSGPAVSSDVVSFQGGETDVSRLPDVYRRTAGVSTLAELTQALRTVMTPVASLDLPERLDALIGEFVRLQNQILADLSPRMTLQRRLGDLFTRPLTGKMGLFLRPLEEIALGVRISFEPGAEVRLRIEPKADHAVSPESHLNTVALDFAGQSPWLALEVLADWRELSLAERFQFSLYGHVSRDVFCQLLLRLPKNKGDRGEVVISKFEVLCGTRNTTICGDLHLPDFIELNTAAEAHLMLFFDTTDSLSVTINYLNVYLA